MIDFTDSDAAWFEEFEPIPAPEQSSPAYVLLAYDGEFMLHGIRVRNYEARVP